MKTLLSSFSGSQGNIIRNVQLSMKQATNAYELVYISSRIIRWPCRKNKQFHQRLFWQRLLLLRSSMLLRKRTQSLLVYLRFLQTCAPRGYSLIERVRNYERSLRHLISSHANWSFRRCVISNINYFCSGIYSKPDVFKLARTAFREIRIAEAGVSFRRDNQASTFYNLYQVSCGWEKADTEKKIAWELPRSSFQARATWSCENCVAQPLLIDLCVCPRGTYLG